MQNSRINESSATWFTLFTTTTTLVCCAIPIALVTFGLGATVAAMTSALPFLIVLSKYKVWVFAFSGLMLAVTAWFMFRPGRSCPVDPQLAALCERAQKWNQRIYWSSVALWGIGFFAAFLALPLRIALDL
ncbi:MAG: hypothetical protein ACC641_00375 [Acidiferrobacterales bacterium]